MTGFSGSPIEAASPVFTAHQGTNSVLIAEVARLYLRPGMAVADVTYGKGVFWKRVDLTSLDFHGTDLQDGVDFRALPYPDEVLDVVVLDPPYLHNPGRLQVEDRYRNLATTRGLNHEGILTLYTDGMAEARRVLKPGGQLWVKTQDEIANGKPRWTHLELYERARLLGFGVQDLFVLVRANATLQVKRQLHARKNHSYLWIFAKP